MSSGGVGWVGVELQLGGYVLCTAMLLDGVMRKTTPSQETSAWGTHTHTHMHTL